jgi:hypothetical protein
MMHDAYREAHLANISAGRACSPWELRMVTVRVTRVPLMNLYFHASLAAMSPQGR